MTMATFECGHCCKIATVMRRQRLEWFGHVKRRDETENIRAVVDMKMEGKRPRGRPKLRWKDTVKRDMKAWSIKEEWATDREKWRSLCKTRYGGATPHRETAAKGKKGKKLLQDFQIVSLQKSCFHKIMLYLAAGW